MVGTSERTFGVWDLTLPARAREPWTLPMIAFRCQEYVIVVGDMGRRMWKAFIYLMGSVSRDGDESMDQIRSYFPQTLKSIPKRWRG